MSTFAAEISENDNSKEENAMCGRQNLYIVV